MKKLWELKGSKTYIQYEVQFTSGRGRLRCAFSGLPASTSPANQSTDIVVPAICNNFASNWSYSAVPIYWICKVLSLCGGLNELKGLIPLLCGEPLGVIRTRTRTSSLHLMNYLPKKKKKKRKTLWPRNASSWHCGIQSQEISFISQGIRQEPLVIFLRALWDCMGKAEAGVADGSTHWQLSVQLAACCRTAVWDSQSH